MSTERVPFRLHANLLQHLVHGQGARPSRAILELVQNAVDAGASRVDITLDAKGFLVVDDGRGFQSKSEITDFFATFGTPQETTKQFGRFRVGRAQAFGWAKTVYRSNAFSMSVDFGSDGQGFELSSIDPPEPGCRISGEWNQFAIEQGAAHPSLVTELISNLTFPPITVTINGQVLKGVKDSEWTHETPEAYFLIQPTGSVKVFNQGVLVTHVPHAQFHIGGTVVSKQALNLTMGRNELTHGCPVWRKISHSLHQFAEALHTEGGTIGTDGWRSYMLNQALLHRGSPEAEVITMVPKRQVSLKDFVNIIGRTRTLAVATRGKLNQVERRAQSKGIPTLHFDTLDRARTVLGVDGTDEDVVFCLLDAIDTRLRSESGGNRLPPIQVLMPEHFPDDSTNEFTVLEKAEWSYPERQFLARVDDAAYDFAMSTGSHPRYLGIGVLKNAEAFTDGSSQIILDRRLVDRTLHGKTSPLEFSMILAHEFAHEGDSRNAGHDEAFAHRYHELTLDHARPFNKLCGHVARAASETALANAFKRSQSTLINDSKIYVWNEQRRHTISVSRGVLRDICSLYAQGKIDSDEMAAMLDRAFDAKSAEPANTETVIAESFAEVDLCTVGIPPFLPFLEIDARSPFDRHPSEMSLVDALPAILQDPIFFVEDLTSNRVTLAVGNRSLSVNKQFELRGDFLKTSAHQVDAFFQWINDLAEKIAPWKERHRGRDLDFVVRMTDRLNSFITDCVHLRRPDSPPGHAVSLFIATNIPHSDVLRYVESQRPDWEFYPTDVLIKDMFTQFEAQAKADAVNPFAFWATWSSRQ